MQDNLIRQKTDGEWVVKVANSNGSDVGGGTQYTEGDVDTTITGNAMMWEDTSNTLVAVSAAKPLPVNASVSVNNEKTDDAAFTPGTSVVSMIGMQADETATDSVDEGDAGAPRMTLDRKQIVTTQPHTKGGCSIFRSLDLDETEEDVKTSPGQVYGMWVTNTATSTRFIKFYNATAASVTVGSTTPVITIGIPGNSSDDVSGHFANGGLGLEFDTAISVAATTGIADADTGAPSANDVLVNIFYK